MRLIEIMERTTPKIKVLGIGNCGINAVNYMLRSGLPGMQCLVADTDSRKLDTASTEFKILLGSKRTKGCGTGADPRIGQEAAQESEAEIKEMLEGAQVLFLIAGLGGGTGTGAAPAIARMAAEMGILTIAAAVLPAHNGSHAAQAGEGMRLLRQHTDSLLLFNNSIQGSLCGGSSYMDAINAPHERILRILGGITDIVSSVGIIHIDWADLSRILHKSGLAIMGVGEASGENRAREATEQAISSPLQPDLSIEGARRVLYKITAFKDVKMEDIQIAANILHEKAHPDALIIYGFTPSDIPEQFRIAVVATELPEPPAAPEQHAGVPTPLDLYMQRKPGVAERPRQGKLPVRDSRAYSPGSTELVYDRAMPESPSYMRVLPN